MPCVTWSNDELGLSASGTLSPTSSYISDSFSNFNFFQHYYISNNYNCLLDLILSNSNKLSVRKSISLIVSPDFYHPSLHIQYPLQTKIDASNTYSYITSNLVTIHIYPTSLVILIGKLLLCSIG